MSGKPSEERLDALRREAAKTGRVAAAGVRAAGSPMPPPDAQAGYYGRPIVKAPVWTWEVPLYFFVGGTAGMSSVLALAALAVGGAPRVARLAALVAAVGAATSPILLTMDLGRPRRFLAMLRVFKRRSPMSVGAFTLVLFGAFSVPTAIVAWTASSFSPTPLSLALAAGSALFGLILAVYTGVLLGATAVPVWAEHHRLLPIHFGVAALGSAASVLVLLAPSDRRLAVLGAAAAAVETILGATLELRGRARAVDPLHGGRSAVLLRLSALLCGPAALLLFVGRLSVIAAACFLLGAIVSRYGWVLAGGHPPRSPRT